MDKATAGITQWIRGRLTIFKQPWGEAVLTLTAAALLMVIVNAPAFQYGLFAEYFEFVGFLYKSHGNLIQTIFTLTGNGFFRPVDWLLTLLSYRALSLDPFILHLRNLVLALVLCGVLYALLARYVNTWYARVLPVIWFALAKVHFEGIGILTVFGTMLASIFILIALWMLDIYLTRLTRTFYLVAILFGLLAIFSKESAVSVVPTAAALVLSKTDSGAIWMRIWRAIKLVMPLIIGIFVLFIFKHLLTGHAVPVTEPYAPHLSWDLLTRNSVAFTAALANLAFTDESRLGVGGIGWLLGHIGLLTPSQGQLLDIEQYLVLAVIISVMIIQQGRRLGSGFFVFVLMACSFGIYMTVNNLGLRYEYEFLLGAAFLGALFLDHTSRSVRLGYTAFLLLFGLNGAISNYNSYPNWQYAVNKASEAQPRLIEIIKESEQEQFAFVTYRAEFWVSIVGASGETLPMLPELTGRPNIEIKYITYQDLQNLGPAAGTGSTKIIDLDNGLLIYPDDFQEPLVIESLHPGKAFASQAFNIQPNGLSALAVITQNATPGTQIYWNGVKLDTAFGSSTLVTALVPIELFYTFGQYEVSISDGIRKSNSVYFTVLPAD